MTRITNVDQVLLLLQEKLRRMDRSRTARTGRPSAATPRPLARLQALAALDHISEEDFKRTMVRALLTEELGEGLGNDPAFQTVVDDVFRIISASEQGRELIEQAARQLRAEP
ncbi:MAG: hypothetical protein M3177_03225 [Pseudomonadota bacterium]|nr:hypothetical protein [Pseudomonadota bacterium]